MYTGVDRHLCSVHICICTGALKSRFNAFNACHTHHNKCTHTRTCTPMAEWSSNLFERFIYSVFTKTRVLCALDEKGQARDTRVHLPMVQQLVCPQTVVNHLESWKLLSVLRQTKNNELNHYVLLAESNIQRRACWVTTPDCRAALNPATDSESQTVAQPSHICNVMRLGRRSDGECLHALGVWYVQAWLKGKTGLFSVSHALNERVN